MRGDVPHLHVSSGFSARYGASHPGDLIARAAERGIGTVALTDRDMVTGTVRFAKAAAAAGVKPVFGVDLGVAPHVPPAEVRRRTPVRGGVHIAEAAFRATFLARDAQGWARLCRMVSAAHAEAFPGGAPPVASWEMLAQYADEGLMVLLGPASEPLRALAVGRADIAERLLAPWQRVVGGGLRLEVVCWGLSGTGPGSVRLAAHTLALADRLGIPAVLANAVRYADAVQHRVADVLDAARLLRPVDRRRLDCGERWLKDGPAMTDVAGRVAAAAGADPSRAVKLIADTIAVADVCEVAPVRDLGLGVPHFPEPSVVGAGPGSEGAMRLLRQRCESGMAARGLDRDRRAMDQLDHELGTIGRLHYEPYFLAVAQVVADVRDMGIRVAARGSGPAPWSTTAFSSPLRTRWSTTCSSNGSCPSGAPRCRTSTSTWSPLGAWRSTTGSSTASGGSGSRSPACPRPTVPGTPCGTPASRSGSRPPPWTGSRSPSPTSGPATSAPHSRNCPNSGSSRPRPGGSGRCGSSPKGWTRCRAGSRCTRAE